jgi:hypothetical protein
MAFTSLAKNYNGSCRIELEPARFFQFGELFQRVKQTLIRQKRTAKDPKF